MGKLAIKLAAIVCLFLVYQSCNNNPVSSSGTALVEGMVVETGTLRAVQGALIRSNLFPENTTTDANGFYSLTIEIPDSSARVITLYVSKEGFIADTLSSAVIQNGKVTKVPDVILIRTGGPSQTSGDASNVVLVAIESSNIFVSGSGGNENSDLTFEVRDDKSVPVDLQHQVTVSFRITGGPAGGEFLSPDSAQTDINGRVVTTINSGTKAGALQVVAEIAGKAIASAPVPIAIHGGLPDQSHFSVVSEDLNFAGYNIFNLQNVITAFVGDKYSNPVPPGTAVQFQSTGGIIEGSAVTDELGRASVRLISAEPQPQGIPGQPFPFTERGFALITAQTVGENQQSIAKSTIVLFSGVTQITNVTPSTFSIAAGKSQSFNYTVSDQNGNPLVAGTSINIGTNNGDVAGDTGISLEDVQLRGPGLTDFSFVLTNSTPDSFLVKDATVTIKVTSQNGNATRSVTGQMLPIQ